MQLRPNDMQWFELEGETASGHIFRTSHTNISLVAAIKHVERIHPGWRVTQATEVDAVFEKALAIVKAALADNQLKVAAQSVTAAFPAPSQ